MPNRPETMMVSRDGVAVRINVADFDPEREESLEKNAKGRPAGGLEGRTVPELRELADGLGLELANNAKKADIVAAIEQAQSNDE